LLKVVVRSRGAAAAVEAPRRRNAESPPPVTLTVEPGHDTPPCSRHAALQLGGARLALQLPVQRARGRDGRDADVVLLGQRGRGGDGEDNSSKAKPRPRCISGSVR